MVLTKKKIRQSGSILFISLLLFSYSSHGAYSYDARSGDALHTKVRTELKIFTDWLTANSAKGYIGEVGWPDNRNGDGAQWNLLADNWYKDADAANLWVMNWSTGSYWGNYNLASYKASGSNGIDTPNTQASIIEAHPTTNNYERGINVSGGSFGTASDGSFSNQNPGTYGVDYFYNSQNTFNYLASRGIKVVRLDFRWERLQPTLNSALDPTALQQLQDEVTKAGNAGLKVILEVHNFGEYWLYNGTTGVRQTIGSAALPDSDLDDFWTRMSTAFKSNTSVLAYDLMNEPNNIASALINPINLNTFDSDTQNWGSDNGSTLSYSSSTYHTNVGSLAVSKALGSGTTNMRVNDNHGNTRDISANGPTVSAYVYLPVGTPGTNWTAHVEVQDSSYTYHLGTDIPLSSGKWTQISYSPATNVLQNARVIGVQFTGTNVNGSPTLYIDDVQQGTIQTGAKVWEGASQESLNAIRTNADTKLIMVPGYNYSQVQSWTSIHPTGWITDSANNFMYEAHQYFDSNHSGTYTNSYATEVANAVTAGYSATGTQAPTGSIQINGGGVATNSTTTTLTLNASDDVDATSNLTMMISNAPDFASAVWQTYATTVPWTVTSGDGTKTVYIQYQDEGGNISPTYSASINLITQSPTFSNIGVTNNSNTSVSVSWSSSTASSSMLSYGLTSSYTHSTSEQDLQTRVTAHVLTLSSLVACSVYHYQVISNDIAGNNQTSADYQFITPGCVGNAPVIAHSEQSISNQAGGSILLSAGNSNVGLTVPGSYASVNTTFQAKQLDSTTAIQTVSTPSGYNPIGNYMYDLKSFSDITTLVTTFLKPLSVTLSYNAQDVAGMDTALFKIFRWDNGTWTQLDNCQTNTSTFTVTCQTSNFSVFALESNQTKPSENISFSPTPTIIPENTSGSILPNTAATPITALTILVGSTIAITGFWYYKKRD